MRRIGDLHHAAGRASDRAPSRSDGAGAVRGGLIVAAGAGRERARPVAVVSERLRVRVCTAIRLKGEEQTWLCRSATRPRTSRRRPRRARSSSTTGSATRGRCCSRTRGTSPRCARPSSATWPRSSPSSTAAASRSSGSRSIPVDNHEKWAEGHRGDAGHGPELPDHRRRGLQRLEALRDAAGRRRRRPDRAHAGRQPDRAQRVRDRPGQEDQADPRLSDDDGAQLRRGAARDRLAAADREAQGRDAGATGSRATT